MSDEGPLETMMAPDTPPPAEPADEPISVTTRTPVYYLGTALIALVIPFSCAIFESQKSHPDDFDSLC